jgi:hypothetical protein
VQHKPRSSHKEDNPEVACIEGNKIKFNIFPLTKMSLYDRPFVSTDVVQGFHAEIHPHSLFSLKKKIQSFPFPVLSGSG